MKYALTVILTLATSWIIINLIKYKTRLHLGRIVYRQSDMHNLLKQFFSRNIIGQSKVKSQLNKRIEKKLVSILIVDNKAYWVTDNIFYVSDVINNAPDMETAIPIDTSNMSKSDIDKMLFILDNLSGGKNNDSGSTGNK